MLESLLKLLEIKITLLMTTKIPFYIEILFIGLIVYLLVFLYKSLRYAKNSGGYNFSVTRILVIIFAWLGLMGLAAGKEFFTDFSTMPPKFLVAILVPLISLILLISIRKSREVLLHFPVRNIVGFQSFRIVMEGILWLIFIYGIIPEQMTLEGRNWDVLVGLTAPVAVWMVFTKRMMGNKFLIVWNIFGILMLTNIVITALLSAPLPIRFFMNEPANTMIVYYPMVWLPSFVVPMAYFGHFVSLAQCLQDKKGVYAKSV
jgi:hypothetical protein